MCHVDMLGLLAAWQYVVETVILLIKIRKKEKKAHLSASSQVVVLVVLPIHILIRSTLLLSLCGMIEVATLPIRRLVVVLTRLEPVVKNPFLNL